jgi:hypothetical protein
VGEYLPTCVLRAELRQRGRGTGPGCRGNQDSWRPCWLMCLVPDALWVLVLVEWIVKMCYHGIQRVRMSMINNNK